jgi:hypothetical protein
MAVHDLPSHGQTDAGALFLGRVEGVEELGLRVLGDAGTVVAHAHHDVAVEGGPLGGPVGHAGSGGGRHQIALHRHRPPLPHRLHGVDEEVLEDLPHLRAVHQEGGERAA